MSGIFGKGDLSRVLEKAIAAVMERLAAVGGAALVAFENRTVMGKLLDSLSARDKGAMGNGVADDTAAVKDAASGIGKVSAYKVTKFDNPAGTDVTPDGVAVHAGTHRVFNPAQHKYMQTFGAEVMQHWLGLFAKNSNTIASGDGVIKKIVISGDSVTNGFGNTTGKPFNVFNILAAQRGYKNVSTFNRGQDGKAAFQWLTDHLAGDLAENPDLLILGWGDNDFGLGRTADQLLADMRAGLTTIRAAKPASQLSIILRTPTTMTDPINARTEFRIEQIIDGYKQLARDFQCGFIDAYSLLQNSHDAAGVWMDSMGGAAVHPLDVMQEHICAAIAELALPAHGADWRNNATYNYSQASQSRAANAPPGQYFDGVTMVASSGGSAAGAPYSGMYYVLKQADSATLQLNTPLYGATSGYGISARLGFNNEWGPFLGALLDLRPFLQNGWRYDGTAQSTAYWFSLDGAINIQGTAYAGTLVDGTVIFSLPVGFRPIAPCVFLLATSSGFARLAIDAGGVAKIYGAGAALYVSLNGIKFKN